MMRGNPAAAPLVDRVVGPRRHPLVTDEQSPKVQDNALDLLNPEEILAAPKASGT